MGENRFHKVSVWIVEDTLYIYNDKAISFKFFCDGLKKRLIVKLLHPADSDFLPMNTLIGGFLVEDINFELIMLLAARDIRKDGVFREVVKDYLDENRNLEDFQKDVVAYCMAGKLSE